MTKSNIIGYIAAIEQKSQLSDMNAFVRGVAVSNKDAKVYGVVTGTFGDPDKGKEAALAQIDMGADIVAQSADSTGVGAIEGCLDRNVMCIGYGGDQYEMAPDLMITCFITDCKAVIVKQAERIEDGSFGGLWEPGVAEGICGITDYHNFTDKIPDSTKKLVDDAIAGLKDGSLVVPYEQTRIDEKMDF